MENISDKEIIDKFDNIISLIENSDNYKRYLELKQDMLNNNKIITLINSVKTLQKDIVYLQRKNMDYSIKDNQIKQILNTLNEIPLYIEYNKYHDIINEELTLLKDKVNSYIENI